MTPTLKDVAKLAGVSPSTVSRVLSGHTPVAATTQEQVMRAVEQLQYRPNIVARSLRKQESKTLGFIVPDITNPFFSEVAKGVELEAHARGYRVFLCNTRDDRDLESMFARVLEDQRVDGVICITTVGSRYWEWEAVDQAGIPVVFLDRFVDGFGGDVVYIDNTLGTFEATRHLLGLGHVNVGLLPGPRNLSTTAQRMDGYRQAMQANSLAIRDSWVIHSEFNWQSGHQATTELVERAPELSALVCGNDLIAAAAIRALEERSVSVPEDLAVVGFDDIFLARVWRPALTTMAQPKVDMGRIGVQVLLERRATGRTEFQRIMLEPKLVVRQSCGSPVSWSLSDEEIESPLLSSGSKKQAVGEGLL